MISVLRHSHFENNSWGDGGAKRTAQISEILAENGLGQIWYDPDATRIFKKSFAAIDGLRVAQSHKIQSAFSKTALTQLGFNYYKRLKTMEYYSTKSRTLLWESSRQQNFLMSYAALDSGFAVIGLPHNLESLVPGQLSEFTGKAAPDWFDEELHSLKQCHHIFTISREEQYLLKLFGIQADYLPYYPPKEVREFLLDIRKIRSESQTSGKILMLGTAGNKPTEEGMLDRIGYFHSQISDPSIELYVAGYLTERFKDKIPDNPRIHFLGSLTNDQLKEALISCSAAWIHQPLSTGALTKIPELMMAGIPIILNADSARSHFHLPGLYVYDNDRDCRKIFQRTLKIPEIPYKPTAFESHFVEIVRRWANSIPF